MLSEGPLLWVFCLSLGNGPRLTTPLCALGYPAPKLYWFKDGQPLTASAHIRMTDKKTLHTLEIISVTREDSGQYAAYISNAMGAAYSSAQLLVQGEEANRADMHNLPIKAAQNHVWGQRLGHLWCWVSESLHVFQVLMNQKRSQCQVRRLQERVECEARVDGPGLAAAKVGVVEYLAEGPDRLQGPQGLGHGRWGFVRGPSPSDCVLPDVHERLVPPRILERFTPKKVKMGSSITFSVKVEGEMTLRKGLIAPAPGKRDPVPRGSAPGRRGPVPRGGFCS